MKNLSSLVLLLLISCSNKDDILNYSSDCIGNAYELKNSLTCIELDSAISNKEFCQFNASFKLSIDPKSKEYVPQFCNETNTLLEYRNAMREIIYLEITFKRYYSSISTWHYSLVCPIDSLKKLAYCIQSEKIEIDLVSKDKTLSIRIEISQQLDYDDPLSGKVADYLHISRDINSQRRIGEFSALITQRNSKYLKLTGQEFFPSIMINNEKYFNVISYDNSGNPEALYKYYYNKEYGLIAFRDAHGVYWNLIR